MFSKTNNTTTFLFFFYIPLCILWINTFSRERKGGGKPIDDDGYEIKLDVNDYKLDSEVIKIQNNRQEVSEYIYMIGCTIGSEWYREKMSPRETKKDIWVEAKAGYELRTSSAQVQARASN